MKHLIALILGAGTGGLIAAAALYLATGGAPQLSSLDGGSGEQIGLSFSAVAKDTILFTNDGESTIRPHPSRVLQLWEPTIMETSLLVTTLRNMRGEYVGLGIKFTSLSEKTRIINGELLADSVWHVYLPGRGTMLVEQSENYWNFVRDIVVPAHWNSGDSWRGSWRGTITVGPDPLGLAIVHGGSGALAGVTAEAAETLTASAYSAIEGPVALEGQLLVELPRGNGAMSADSR